MEVNKGIIKTLETLLLNWLLARRAVTILALQLMYLEVRASRSPGARHWSLPSRRTTRNELLFGDSRRSRPPEPVPGIS